MYVHRGNATDVNVPQLLRAELPIDVTDGAYIDANDQHLKNA